jgi:hypothetical protein
MELFAQLNGFVCQFAEWERVTTEGRSAEWRADLVTYLTAATTSGDYPHLAEALGGGSGTPLDADQTFARSLDRLLSMIVA